MYEIRFSIKNHDGTIKMWSRRGIEEEAEVYDTFVADAVKIEVVSRGVVIKTYTRGRNLKGL